MASEMKHSKIIGGRQASGVIEGGFWADGEYIRGSISVDDLTTPTEGADSVSRRADLNCEPSGEPLQNGLKPSPGDEKAGEGMDHPSSSLEDVDGLEEKQ